MTVDRFTRGRRQRSSATEHRQQQPGNDERSGSRDVCVGPEEIDTVQKADEERRIAERTQCAADIGDQNDEKDKDVNVVSAARYWRGSAAGSESWTHPWCRRYWPSPYRARGCAALFQRRAPDVAADENATCDGVEGEQQHDEAQIFAQHRMHEGREHRLAAAKPRDRRQRQRGPGRGDLAVVRVPEFWKQQRPERDRQQQAGEGQCKWPLSWPRHRASPRMQPPREIRQQRGGESQDRSFTARIP